MSHTAIARAERTTPDASGLRALYDAGRQRGGGDVDNGLAGLCADVLANDHASDLLGARDSVIFPRVVATLEYCEDIDDGAARERASRIAINATLDAQALLDEQAEGQAAARTSRRDDDTTPLDLFASAGLLGSPQFPAGTLPKILDAFVADESERQGCDPGIHAAGVLVAVATALDDCYQIQPGAADTGWREPARLWMTPVIEPGGKKTAALNKDTAPLREIENQWVDEDGPKHTRYRIELKRYNRDVDRYIKSGVGEPPIEPERPRRRRLFTSDTTVEALAEILVDNPRGVLVFTDELSAWFGGFDAYRARGAGRDRALWLSAWDGGARAVDRATREAVRVPNWSVNLLGGIQPGPFRRIAKRIDDDGLLQRIFPIFAREAGPGVDRAPNASVVERYHDLIRRLVALPVFTSGFVVTLAPDAQAERRYIAEIARDVAVLPQASAAFRGHLAKWEGLYARLLLTFHAAESLTIGDRIAPTIPCDTARRCARFMVDFLLPNAARFYSELLGQDHLENARWVAGLILSHQLERISARDIARAHHELRDNRDDLTAAMRVLEVANWVDPIESSGGKWQRWRVNPAVHVLFAERAEAERVRRLAIRERIQAAVRRLGAGAEP